MMIVDECVERCNILFVCVYVFYTHMLKHFEGKFILIIIRKLFHR